LNAERLHEIASETLRAIDDTQLVQRLAEVDSALSEVMNQPQNPDSQLRLSNGLAALDEAVDRFAPDSFSPAWRESLDEIRGETPLGRDLADAVRNAVARNGMTPAAAFNEVEMLLNQLRAFCEALRSLTAAFDSIGVGADELAPGEAEVGFLIPRAAVDDDLRVFGKEMSEVAFILETFSELATGDATTSRIRTISSSALTVFMSSLPAVAACMATAVERLLAAYKNLLEVKRLREEFRKHVPDATLPEIEEHANSVMEQAIQDATAELFGAYYKGADKPRREELENKTRIALRKLANRLDQGYDVEVRAVLPEPSEDADERLSAERAADIVHAQTIIDAAPRMRFMKMKGERILHLPEAIPTTPKRSTSGGAK
jgi:hypothetical protein